MPDGRGAPRYGIWFARGGLVVALSVLLIASAGWGGVPRNVPSAPPGGVHGAAISYNVPVDPEFLPREVHQSASGLDRFGASVAISPTLLVVGAPESSGHGVLDSGEVQVTNLASGTSYLLFGQDTANGRFGTAVALGDGLIAVGAPGDLDLNYTEDVGAGAVFVFNATTGAVVDRLYSPNPTFDGSFGTSVALAGSYLAVGAPGEQLGEGPVGSGAAYVFDLQTSTSMTFFSPYSVEYGAFGNSVALSGTTLVVGAPFELPCRVVGGSDCAGNAYVFSVASGDLEEQLPNDLGGRFGWSVAISGATIVVGAPSSSTLYGAVGAAGVFQLNSNVSITLATIHPSSGGDFGTSVAVSGDVAVVGAPDEEPDYVTEAGDAYAFSTVSGGLDRGVFVADPVAEFAYLGSAVALSGSTLVAGAVEQNDTDGPYTGAVFLYPLLPWTVSTPSVGSAASSGEFGSAVAVSNGIMVVGAKQAGSLFFSGEAFLVNTFTGAISALSDPHSTSYGDFGTSVAIDGTYAVVGAPGEVANGTGFYSSGNVYVYSASTGALLRTLTSGNPVTAGGFGHSVAISGVNVAVGAWAETPSGQPAGAGAAYLFNASSGAELAYFISPNSASGGGFGYSVGVSGSTVVVGAPYETVGSEFNAGNAYVFSPGAPLHPYNVRTLVDPNAQGAGDFGDSVAVSGGTVVVGALDETDGSSIDAGHAYIFGTTSGTLVSVLHSTNVTTYGQFGISVSTNGPTVVVGAPEEFGDGFQDGGQVYVFNSIGVLLNRYFSAQTQINGLFGWSVGIGAGGIIVAGAPGEGGETGTAYVL